MPAPTDRVVLSLPAPPQVPLLPPAHSEVADELKTWGRQHVDGGGMLMTPPEGHLRSDVKKARAYVQDMVNRLAGPRLQKEGIHLVVNLYSGREINAFMAGHQEGDTPQGAIARTVGFDGSGQPLYELAVNAGTLRQLQSEEELAFTLGHELSHLFEHHSDPTIKLQPAARWLQSQAHEAEADQKGIEMMVAAGYDPEGALQLLNRLFKREKPDTEDAILRSFDSAVSGHHQEGVRIALAQGKIELMRRSDPKARPSGRLHPLPEFLCLHANPRDAAREPRMAELTKAVVGFTQRYFLGKAGVPWLSGEIVRMNETPGEPPELKDFRFQFYRPTPDQLADLFEAGVSAVKQAAASRQDKVDAVLRLYLFLDTMWYPYGSPALDAQQKDELAQFLLQNTSGTGGWKAGAFLEKLAGDAPGFNTGAKQSEYPFQQFANACLTQPALGDVAARLAKVDGQWRTLLGQVPQMLLVDRETGRADDLGWVARLVGTLGGTGQEKMPPGLLHDALKQSALDFFQGADLSKWIENTGGRFSGMTFYSVLRPFFDPEAKPADAAFAAQIKAALEPGVTAFLAFRERYALGWLHGTAAVDYHRAQSFFRALFDSQKLFPFSADFRARLEPALLAFMRRANHEKDFFDSDFFRGPDPMGIGLDGFGAMLGEMLASPQLSTADKQEVFDFLRASHEAKESLRRDAVPGQAEHQIAGWLVAQEKPQLLSLVEHPDYGQYAEAFSRDLGRMHGIGPVSTSDEGLADLARRQEAGEFRIKVERGPDGKPRGGAVKQELKRRRDDSEQALQELEFIAAHDQDRQLSPLTFLGSDRAASATVAARMRFADLRGMLAAVARSRHHFQRVHDATVGILRPTPLSTDAGTFLLDVLVHTQGEAPSLDEWYAATAQILDENEASIESRPEFKQKLQDFLVPRLQALPPDQIYAWLGKKHVLAALSPDQMAALLLRVVDPQQGVERLAGQVKQVVDGLALRKNHPQGYERFRDGLAEAAHLQPGDVDAVFGPERAASAGPENIVSMEIRGLSALVELTRQRPVDEQIAMIEYLMGRRADMPDFLLEVTAKADVAVPLTEIVRDARTQLQHVETAVRVMVANSFLAGPSSFVRDPKGLDQLLGFMLKDVKPEHQALARRLARALLDSQGSTDSLALAYVLGQRSDSRDGKLSEADVLNNLFDAYGVPGIKFKQYLAFTSEFAEFREAFEASEDSAMPLSYYQAVRLVNDRFHGQWPPSLKIERILGSGSVNVAIRYFDPGKGKDEVIAIARKDIETVTDYDFIRFKKFLASLNQSADDRQQFGYLLGLADIVHDSVALEFDKAAAEKMQHGVQPLYRREVNGWHVQSVDAFQQENMAVFMDEAKGITARRLRAKDPEAYRSAMRAIGQVELDALFGVDQHGGARPVPLHANPDFHDGQVLVDPAARTVTILDFGQAVPISNAERDYGIEMLEVIGHARSLHSSLKLLQRRCPALTAADLAPILDRTDRMDAFVHLLSMLNQKGAKVPIAVVHWVLAINRQIALGEKTSVPVDKMVRHLVATRRLGGSLALYNRFHLAAERAHAVAASLVPGGLSGVRIGVRSSTP